MDGIRQKILDKAHSFKYSLHPGSTKIYIDLRDVYWWNDMNKDIKSYVMKYANGQQVKMGHQSPRRFDSRY